MSPDSSSALAAKVVELAARCGVRFGCAESLTGGLLAAQIVSVPGASRVFVGGVVAYETAVKHHALGVDAQQLTLTGPVAAAVAEQMAAGVSGCLGQKIEYAVATTGVAGPDPDPQTGQEPGVFYIGVWDTNGACISRRFQVGGSRAQVRQAAVNQALKLLQERIALREATESINL